jgi:hypothetical protein
MRLLALLSLLAAPALSEHLHLGLKGGAPLNDLVESGGSISSLSSRWTLGPMIDLDLPFGLGIEFNALYRRTGYRDAQDHTAGSWDFPLLLKYKFPGVVARPYISGGWVYRNIGDIPRLAAGSNGVAFAGGLQISVPVIRLTPEIRWTRWESAQAGPLSVQASRNQFEVLVGLTF